MLRHWLTGLSYLGCLAVLLACSSSDKLQAQHEAKPWFARLIGPQTMVFGHLRVYDTLQRPFFKMVRQQLKQSGIEPFKEMEKMLGIGLDDIDSVTVYVEQPEIDNGRPKEPRRPHILISGRKPIAGDVVRKSLGDEVATTKFGKYELQQGKSMAYSLLDEKTLLLFSIPTGPQRVDQQYFLPYFTQLEAEVEVNKAMLESINLAVGGKYAGVAGFRIPEELSTLLQAEMNNVPPAATPFKALVKVQSGQVSLQFVDDSPNDIQLQVRGRFQDEKAAQAGLGSIKFAIAAAKMSVSSIVGGNAAENKVTAQAITRLFEAIKTETKGSEVHLSYEANTPILMALLLPAIQKVRVAANRTVSGNNMRQALIAMHNYYNDYDRLPDVVSMKEGKPLHSWRVHILPYVEYDQLYKQIKLDEPWDSEHNLKIFESVPIPKIYDHPGQNEGANRKTYYKAFYSKPDKNPAAGFKLGARTTFATMVDGTSNTIALVEAGPPVLWYKPEDIEFDPNVPLPKMVSPWPDNRVQVAFFDGHIQSLWLGQKEDLWKASITANGGEVVDRSGLELKEKK
ncbi:MAG: DUF1559 domain-containing protein [Planctomycetia bacterium]|nr:DUF1559 domain-containing protein [Planctomycetia bacterium]